MTGVCIMIYWVWVYSTCMTQYMTRCKHRGMFGRTLQLTRGGGDWTPLIPDVPPSQEEQGPPPTPSELLCGWTPLKSGFCRNWKSWNVNHWVCVTGSPGQETWKNHTTHPISLRDCLHLRRHLSETNHMMLCNHKIWSCWGPVLE